MMKKHFLTLVCICATHFSFAQINEIGFFIGGTNYVGDIGQTTYVNPNKLGGALLYKYNYNPRIAYRATYSYLPIQGNDANSNNAYRAASNRRFTNTIHEMALGLEFNFRNYNLATHNQRTTPYLLVEFVGLNYQTAKAVTNTTQVHLKSKTTFAVPIGLGVKGGLGNGFAYALETKARYTFEDDLDYSTARFPILNFGGTKKDWYFFTGFSIVYIFGRPACY